MSPERTDVVIVPVPHSAEANRLVGGLRALGITADCPNTRNASRSALGTASAALCVIAPGATEDQTIQAIAQLRPAAERVAWIMLGGSPEDMKPLLLRHGIKPVAYLEITTPKDTLLNVLESLHSLGIHGLQVSPTQRPSSPNVRRERPKPYLMGLAALTTVIAGAILGYVIAQHRAPVTTTPVVAFVEPFGPPKPVVVYKAVEKYLHMPELTGPVQLEGPPYIPPPPEFASAPEKPPVLDVAPPIWTRESKAIVHVIGTVDEANRIKGLDPGRIASLATRFTDPAYIEGRGEQTRSGLTASLQIRSLSWPAWREVPLQVTAYTNENDVIVEVRSRFRAENPSTSRVMADEVIVAYTVQFDGKLDLPLIRRVDLRPPIQPQDRSTSLQARQSPE